MIEFDDLTVAFRRGADEPDVVALRDFSLSVGSHEAVALVGESGSGKTTAARAALGEVGRSGVVLGGRVVVGGRDVLGLSGSELAAFRRTVVGYVPQNPGASLNPVRRVGRQIADISSRTSGYDVKALLERVQLRPVLARRYPHQLSGGEQQRVSLALALAGAPQALILDEPTTGLDVGVQVEILRLFRGLVDEGLSVLYVTHDLAAAAVVADRAAVLYAGELVEVGQLETTYRAPRHPYTEALLGAMPSVSVHQALTGIPGMMLAPEARNGCCVFHNRCRYIESRCTNTRPPYEITDARGLRCFRGDELTLAGINHSRANGNAVIGRASGQDVVLSAENVTVRYRTAHGGRPAVDSVTLDICRAETLALVGESGSGKTSLAHALVGLVEPVAGAAMLDGVQLARSYRRRSRDEVRRIQYIFQNSALALNPRHTIRTILATPLNWFFALTAADRAERIAELMGLVGLPERLLDQRPRALSGGEQQRVAIARALAARPDVMICDEIVSALDVSVQAAIVKLLGELRDETGVAMLFISHDLGVVRSLADRTAVMSGGSLVEIGPTESVFESPESEYTRFLLASVPDAAKVLN